MMRIKMREDEMVTLPDGRRMGYADYGDPEGIPVFYFHGWPSSRYQAAFLDEEARKRGIRLVAPDRPGVGLSDPLPGRKFSDWPSDAADFATALGIERFRIFGISGGGPYTLATCARRPERVIKAAVMCGAPPLTEKADRAHLHWAYRTLSGIKSARRAALRGIIPLSRWMIARGADRAPMSWMLKSVPERDRVALHSAGGWDMVTRSFLEAIRPGASAMLTDGELYLDPWDFDPSEIQVPIRIWHGEADANLPCEVARRLAARIPNAETCWIPEEGHYSIAVYHSGEVLDWLIGDA